MVAKQFLCCFECLIKLLAPLADNRLAQTLINGNAEFATILARRFADVPAVVIQPLATIAEFKHTNWVEVARNRLLKATLALTISLIYGTQRYAILVVASECALATVDKRCGVVAIAIHNHKALRLNRLDALLGHIWFVVFVLLLEDVDLLNLEWSTSISLDATSTLALRQIARKLLSQQVGTNYFTFNLNHCLVSSITKSYNSPSEIPAVRACFGTMLPLDIPGIEFTSIR